jgi:hypothetical protein
MTLQSLYGYNSLNLHHSNNLSFTYTYLLTELINLNSVIMVITTLAMPPAALASAPKQNWEQILDMHAFEMKVSMSTGDFSYFTSLRLQDIQTQVDHSAILQDAAPDLGTQVNTNICKLNQDACKMHQSSFEAIQGTVMSITNDPNAANNESDWEKKIDAQADAQKAAVLAAIDDCKAKAKAEIKKLPPAAQPVAANVFIQGSNVVAGVLSTFKNAVANVLSKVADFVGGIFNKITDAYNTVKDAVSGAVNTIGGFFGSIFSIEPEDAPNGNREKNATLYTGLLGWPATLKLATASRALAYVQDVLADRGYDITDDEVKKDKTGIASRTVFSTSKGTVTLDQLSKVWEEVVDSLGKDGHYIPTRF